MRFQRLVRRLHKWLGVMVAIQLLLWMASGLFMTAVPIDIVRGNHLVAPLPEQTITAPDFYPLDSLLENHKAINSIQVRHRLSQVVYVVQTQLGKVVVDATSGEILKELTAQQAQNTATQVYTGTGKFTHTEYIAEAAQAREASGRPFPLWKVNFDDTFNTAIYISASLGDVVAVRSDIWRWFDIFWMLHIMDYEERSDFNNPLVILMVSLGLFMTLTGIVMLGNATLRQGVHGLIK